MKTEGTHRIFLCNGATPSVGLDQTDYAILDYRSSSSEPPMVPSGTARFRS